LGRSRSNASFTLANYDCEGNMGLSEVSKLLFLRGSSRLDFLSSWTSWSVVLRNLNYLRMNVN
jgi:hypothetical protein